MEATNLAVLAELQEYAQLYFDAIKEHNTTDGVCELRPGNYSAKELADREKAACGAYRRPVGDIFDEEVSISVDTFRMRFPYREIFYILARWEAMCRPGKSLKSVFTVGDVEEKTAKVLLCEQTELGKYKAKGMKLQHLTGNWWAPRKLPKCDSVELVYELNGVMFLPGTQAWSDDISNRNSAVMERCAKLDDAKTTEALLNFIATQESAPTFGYFVEVARRAGINTANTPKSEQPATPAETPQISTEAAETVNVSADVENAKNEPIKHISEIMGICRLHDEVTGEETDEYKYYKWLTYCHASDNYMTIADKALAEVLAWIFEAAYRKGKGHIIAKNKDGVLLETVIAAQPTEAPRISTETAETTNVSAEGEKAAETKEMPQIFNCEWQTVEHFKAIPNIAKLAKAGIIINGVGYHTEYLDQSHNVLARVDNLPWDMERHDFPYQGSGVFGKTELFENWEDAVIATIDALTDYLHTEGIEPPQSLEAPPTAKHPTPPPILGRRRRKRARRGAQAAPGLRSAPGMCAGGCGASRPAGRREAPVTSLRGSVGISGMVHGGSFHRGALPRAGPPSLLSAGEGVKVA